ncbi:MULTISPECIES: hypothetical protein [Rhizobium]|uniref:Protein-S-isoprenylcysteine O-methyltransferase Ste14 n=1 Tax=Rhizobium esperanzae TaxID=1967781 RepID=A0A7W6USC8_9HYPH|nr:MULTISPECIES: hypothetical protein [Rhizobium]MBB4443415.1 protein-S-isoprenylcysteine O-methyltransferase Ste14 [Rhizobium esperanzae]
MVRPVRAIVIAVLVLLVAFASAWSSLALWYRLPLPEVGRHASAISFGLFGASVVVALFGRRRWSLVQTGSRRAQFPPIAIHSRR